MKYTVGRTIFISKIDTNKKVEVNKAFFAELQKHKYLWYMRARAFKDRNGRKMLGELGGVIWNEW